MLFDCAGGRVRVLRSASYAERDRRGAARADDVGGAWFSAEADTPAATLLAAACDPAFRWPLRGASEVSPSPKLEGAMLRTSATGSVAPIERAVNLVQVPPPADAPSPIDVQPLAVSAAPEPIEKVSPPAFAGVERKAADTMAWPTVRRTAIAQAPAGAGFLQKARYVPDSPETLASSSAHTATVAPRAGGLITTTGSAMRAGLRWAVAGPGWLARRMERVFHNGPILPHGQLGPIRQAQLY
jgi:hypothetical protein